MSTSTIGAIEQAIKEEIKKETERLIEAAVDDFRKKLRARVGELAVGVLNYSYEVARGQQRLVITVNLKEPEGDR